VSGSGFAWAGVAVVVLAGAGCDRDAAAVMSADVPVRSAEAAVSCPPAAAAGAPRDVMFKDVSGTFRSAWAIAERRTDRDARSLLLSWDGCAWHEEPSPVTAGWVKDLRAVWSDGKDVWVSGGQMLFRRLDGWQTVSATTPAAAFWGSGPRDIWMRGDMAYGAVTHWNGAKLESERIEGMAGYVSDLWGSGPNDVWVAGGDSAARRDAKGWQVWKLTEQGYGWGMHGAGGGRDVWVSTPDAFHHWDGRTWSRVDGFGWESVWKMGTIGDGVYAWTSRGELRLRTGSGWSVVGTLRPFMHPSGVHASDGWRAFFTVGNEVWADSGADGVQGVMRRDAGKWIPVGAGTTARRAEDVVALWSDGRSTLWAAVSFRAGLSAPAGEIRRLDRGQTTWTRAAALDQFPTAIHGRAPDDVWVVGFGGATWHWDGKIWRSIPTGAHQNLYAVWTGASDDVWANGERGVRFNWDGKAWRRWLQGNMSWQASGFAGTGTRDVWSAGENYIDHWDGRGWGVRQEGDVTLAHQGSGRLFSLFAVAPDDVWAVGTGGEIERRGRHAGDIHILPRPLILHWTGRAWTQLSRPDANPTAKVLRAVTGTSATNVWAVGDEGTILRWDGKRWSTVSSPTHEDLTAVAIDADGSVWIGGNNGTLLRLDADR
jgi:hypothetical protein